LTKAQYSTLRCPDFAFELLFPTLRFFDGRLPYVYGDCNPVPGIPAVVQIIAVFRVIDIHIIVFIPVVMPVFRPRIKDTEPIVVVLKTGISAENFQREAIDSKCVARTEVAAKMVVGNMIAVVAAPLLPGAVLGLPAMGAMLLPHAMLFTLLNMLHRL